MISDKSLLAGSVNEEIPALIETLLTTEQRLEELTAGEVDTVAGRDGRTFVFRRAQDQLRHSEATKQADILNALPTHLALLDTQGNIISVNEAWRQFADANLFHSPGYGVGLNYLAICDHAQGDHSSEAHQVAAGVRAVLDGTAQSFSIEYPCHSPNEDRWFLLAVTPLASDRPNGAVVMHLNVTERKQTEQLLRSSEERFRIAAETANDVVYEWDLKQSVEWLGNIDGLLGYEPGEFLRTLDGWANSVHPEDVERTMAALQTHVEGRATYSIEYRIRRKDGVYRWWSARGAAARTPDGKPTRMIGSITDITERKQAEEARDRLAITIESTTDLVGITDAAGNHLYLNCAARSLLGVGLDEDITKTNSADFVPNPASHRSVTEGIPTAARLGIWSGEIALLSRSGQEFPVSQVILAHKTANGEVESFSTIMRDITERKRTEAALKESESRYHSLFENMVEGYAYCRTLFEQDQLQDFTYVEVNSAFERLTGLKDVVGKKVSDLIPGVYEASPELFEVYGRVALTGKPEKYETYLKSLDIWFSVTVYSHEREHFVAVFDNITERKRVETALRASEAEFRALAEAMPQMVWITRPDGWNIYFSQQWMDYTGLTLQESLGHGWNKPFHPEDQERAWQAWQQATTTISTYSIECRLRRADGVYRWWLIRGVPQLDATGNVIKWFGTCTDIHELKLAELEISRTNQALRQSDEKFRQLADNITDVFWITSPDLKTMEYVSSGYELIWGRSAESLYAHPPQWIETIRPEDRESVLALFETLMRTAPEISAEYRITRPDGTIRWIHDRGFQVRDSAGQLVRLTGIASDITDRKNLEAQLRQAQKMEAIGTLAGGIAHDFNNILAAIMGYSELAQRIISRDSHAQTHLQQVLIASTRAKDLVTQILTFSRQEEPERKVLKLQPIIGETLKLLRASLPSTIEIRQSIDPTAPSVMGDATQLHQVAMNLCVNAGHAMKEDGGVLGIRLACVDIDRDFASAHPELREGPHVCLEVSDSGPGMDRATQERIFEPFFTTKAPGEGTGLGLAVVHGVVKNHEGAIVVSSSLGAGTTFGVYLPVYDRPSAAIIHESDSVPRGKGEHILFVDDEEALVSLGRALLEGLGYRVTTMVDSVEALATFRLQPEDFDLVITDQTMPRLNGAELATALLEIRPALPIILATGYSAGMTQEKARATGFRELIGKPYTIQVLGDAIRRSLVQTKEE